MASCGICDHVISSRVVTASCGDVFHRKCMKDYVKETGHVGLTCPVCFDFISLTQKKKKKPSKTQTTESEGETHVSPPSGPPTEVTDKHKQETDMKKEKTDPKPESNPPSRKRRRSVSFADKTLGRTGRGLRARKTETPTSILIRREGDIPPNPELEPDWYCTACEERVKHVEKQTHILSIGHNIKAAEAKKKREGEKLNIGIPQSNRGYQLLVRLGWDQMGKTTEGALLKKLKAGAIDKASGLSKRNQELHTSQATMGGVKYPRRP
ncbi:hypothetical protein AAMO2058_001334200 [Amorphochlora amoebiformis]